MANPDSNTIVRVNLETVLESVKGYFDMTPAEFNLLMELGSGDAESTHFEWDEFVRHGSGAGSTTQPDHTKALVDGRTFEAQLLKVPDRRGNFCQIIGADVSVSRRANKAKKGGVMPEINRQILIKGYDLNEAMEVILLSQQAAQYGRGQPSTYGDPAQAAQVAITTGSGDVRGDKTAAIYNFILTNTSYGVGGGAASLSDQGIPTGTVNPGVKRALSWAVVNNQLREIHRNSRDSSMISGWCSLEMFGKINEALIVSRGGSSAVIPIAAIETQITPKNDAPTALGSIPYYQGPHQLVKFMSNRYMPKHQAQAVSGNEALEGTASATRLYLLNPKTWKVCYLDRLMRNRMGRDGDRYRTQMTIDFGLQSMFERANADYL